MVLRILAVAFWAVLGSVQLATAQTWVQIEAKPDLRTAEDRARAFALSLPDVAGFQISRGWYAVVLGPYSPAEAAGTLATLKRQGLIPSDSFISDGTTYRQQYWPVGQLPTASPDVASEAAPETTTAVEPAIAPEETVRESRAAEAQLSSDERKALQEALAWYGFYASSIDGAFGPGTRNSMAAWQEALGYEPTGVLSTEQRGILIANHAADLAEFGFQVVTEAEAGIEITLPLSLVQFDRYEPPFVHFSEKNGSGLQIMLISEPGDKASLFGLYDILQTLEVVPTAGERSRNDQNFTINAASANVESFAYAETAKGTVKGYLVVWKPQDGERMKRILPALKASFRASGDKALDPGLVPMDEATRAGLLSGLEIKSPTQSRSGFYVDAAGTVVTTTQAVDQCGRITIDTETDAVVVSQDAATGIAVLRPAQPLAPSQFARFQQGAARIGAEVSVAGYSYEGKLPAPVVALGTFAENAGLNGEQGISRLAISLLAGDAGGPVLDATGAVIGMILPEIKAGARVLPEGVAFAVPPDVIVTALAGAGITAAQTTVSERATPNALSDAAIGMTVLVSCWE